MESKLTLKVALFIFILILIPITFGRIYVPFSNKMFDFHDESQPARIAEFAVNLRHLQIPPRIAPHFSLNMGFPVFNFYAPFSYWITSLIHLAGLSIGDSIKLSFLVAIMLGFASMFLFLRHYVNFYASLVGGALYSCTPFVAMETLIRGNLGEIWFLALFPLALYCLKESSKLNNNIYILCAPLVISFLLTVHNIFSLLSLPILFLYALLLPNKKENLVNILAGFALAAYFIIPSMAELSMTQATKIAQNSNYRTHFLCLKQLWTGAWGYGLSVEGCKDDGLSFMIGKIQIIFGLAGTSLFIYHAIKRRIINSNKRLLFILVLYVISLFLTLYASQFIWEFFDPIFRLFQFPWRFIIFGLFGLAVFSAYVFNRRLPHITYIFYICFIIIIFFTNTKFFQKIQIPESRFEEQYLSESYVQRFVAYKVSEYLPHTVNYKEWLLFETGARRDINMEKKHPITSLDKKQITILTNTPFYKVASSTSSSIIINIHYLPYWKIYINDKEYIPTKLDRIGRPILSGLTGKNTVFILYKQTLVEVIANLISIITLLTLVLLFLRKKHRLY